MNTNNPIFNTIAEQIKTNNVVLYMKGNKQFPQCGFSGALVSILTKLNVDFTTVNVLENPNLRQGIKDYSNWPTVPQLYIKGEFIGGCDIVKELYESGELQQLLTEKQIT